MEIILHPVAVVRNTRTDLSDDPRGAIISEIELLPHIPADAVDGTPILDIKPVMKEFLPVEEIRQP